MCRLKSCCGYFNLRTGCRHIGVLYLAVGLIIFATLAAAFALSQSSGKTEKSQKDLPGYIVGFILATIFLIINILYLYAVHAKKKILLMVWVIYHMITFACLVVIATYRHLSDGVAGLYAAPIAFFVCTIYFVIVVLSYYSELREEQLPSAPTQSTELDTQEDKQVDVEA